MRLFLARHGQTAWNVEMRAQGHSDIPLNPVGLRQAELLADALRGSSVAQVLSSDLKRALATARTAACLLGVGLTSDPRLRERSFGDMEGLDFKKLKAMLCQQQDIEGSGVFEVRPPRGESLEDAWKRMGPVAQELLDEPRDTLVVTHGACAALLLSHLLRANIATSRAFRLANAGVTELVRGPDGFFQIIRYNDVSHLEAESPTNTLNAASR